MNKFSNQEAINCFSMMKSINIWIGILLFAMIISCQASSEDLSLLTSDELLSTCPPIALCPTDSICQVYKVIEQYPRFYHEECENLVNVDNRMKEVCAYEKMIEFIDENIVYPQVAVENNIEGSVVIQFVVRKTFGCLTDIEIVQDIGYGCGIEVQRVVSTMPDFVIGTQRSNPVNAVQLLRYTFEL